MRHEYIDIPATPQPLQEMYWRRQAMGEKLGEIASRLCLANEEYNKASQDMILLNAEIQEEEER